MELDEIKTAWKDMTDRLEQVEKINKKMVNELLDSRHRSAMSKLMKYEVIFLILSLVFVPIMLLEYYAGFFNGAVTILFVSLFSLAAIWQVYKIYLLRKMDINTCSTSELIKKAIRFKVITRMRTVVGLILLIPFFILLFVFQKFNLPMMIGMGVGAVIGLIIGFTVFFKNLKDIDFLIKSYKDIDELEK